MFPRNVKYHLPVFIILVSTLGEGKEELLIIFTETDISAELVLFLVSAIQLTEDCQSVTWQVGGGI